MERETPFQFQNEGEMTPQERSRARAAALDSQAADLRSAMTELDESPQAKKILNEIPLPSQPDSTEVMHIDPDTDPDVEIITESEAEETEADNLGAYGDIINRRAA